MINLKIYSLLLITMLLVITFNVNTHNARATNGLIDESYEIFSNQIEKVKQLDNEKKDKYEEFIDIVDGQYEFSYKEEDNEETLFIKQNIKSINELVSNGYAKIEGDDVILQNENELYAQFGVSSVKWKWYGLNFKMDREMMITISVASLAVRIFGGYVKNLIINGKFSSTSFEQKIKNLIKNSISSYNTYETYGLRTLNKTVILLDEKTGELTSIVEGFITSL